MSSLFNQLADLRPSLPRDTFIQPRDYGGETWYLLHDKVSGRFHRFNALANLILNMMDGRHNLRQILIACNAHIDSLSESGTPDVDSKGSTIELAYENEDAIKEDHVDEDDIVELVQYLYVADLLICDFPAKTQDIFRRRELNKNQFWRRLLKNPVAWKFKIFNPDALLNKCRTLSVFLVSPTCFFIWCFVVAYALMQAVVKWDELSQNSMREVLSSHNLFLIWLIYPFLKVIHELGHALLTKAWGGRVVEFGVVVILGTPLPYVDATAATGFAKKRQRLFVSAAGVMVELFFAAIALLCWFNTEPGLLKSILFNVVLIGSVSTLFFNGNPLMRFDGYHFLCDLLDQPNLASRAQAQLHYYVRSVLYGMHDARPAARSRGEYYGLSIYGVLAFIYRIVIVVSIVIIALNHFPTLGMLLGLWLFVFQLVLPLAKHIVYLAFNKDLAPLRLRAGSGVFALATLLVAFVFFVPLPNSTQAEGVLWLPDSARIRMLASGEVVQVYAESGEEVEKGQKLLKLYNPELIAELASAKLRLKEYAARAEQAWGQDQSQVRLFEQEIATIKSEVKTLQLRVNQLTVTSPSHGTVHYLAETALVGRFVNEGSTLAIIRNDDLPWLRAVLLQDEISEVMTASKQVKVRLSENTAQVFDGQIDAHVPQGAYELPSAVLGTAGGGRIFVDASDANQTKTLERVFIVDVTFDKQLGMEHSGQRAWIKFVHASRPLSRLLVDRISRLLIDLQPKT